MSIWIFSITDPMQWIYIVCTIIFKRPNQNAYKIISIETVWLSLVFHMKQWNAVNATAKIPKRSNASGKFWERKVIFFFISVSTSNYPINDSTKQQLFQPKIQSFESTHFCDAAYFFSHENQITKFAFAQRKKSGINCTRASERASQRVTAIAERSLEKTMLDHLLR